MIRGGIEPEPEIEMRNLLLSCERARYYTDLTVHAADKAIGGSALQVRVLYSLEVAPHH